MHSKKKKKKNLDGRMPFYRDASASVTVKFKKLPFHLATYLLKKRS